MDSRTEQITTSLEWLADATQSEPPTVEVYLRGLEAFDTATINEACFRLAGTETRMPALATLLAACRDVVSVSDAASDAEAMTHAAAVGYQPVSKARSRLWLDHLKAVLDAKKHRRPFPPKPAPLDSADPRTFHRCQACADTGWIESHCPGGTGRTCGRASYLRHYSLGKQGYTEGSCRTGHPFVSRCHCHTRPA